MVSVKVDSAKCDGDGVCVDVCPVSVFELKEEAGSKKANVVREQECILCMACEVQCPTKALTVKE